MVIPTVISFSAEKVIVTPVPSLEIQAPHSFPHHRLYFPTPASHSSGPRSCRIPSLRERSHRRTAACPGRGRTSKWAPSRCAEAQMLVSKVRLTPLPGRHPDRAVERAKVAEPLTVYLLLGHRGGACRSGRSRRASGRLWAQLVGSDWLRLLYCRFSPFGFREGDNDCELQLGAK